MSLASVGQRVWRVVPAPLRRSEWMRALRRRFLGLPRVRAISTLSELDAELAALEHLPYDELKRAFASFRMVVRRGEHLDPSSDAYCERELRIYEWISGKRYSPDNEKTVFDVAVASRRPYPYFTQSAAAVGNQLIAIGFLIKALDLGPRSRVIELGAGWGNLTLALARSGHDVTAVDISKELLAVLEDRARQEHCDVRLVHGDFSVVRDIRDTFDAAVFFESFHHCVDHVSLLDELDRIVAPGGKIALAAEPISDDFDEPWGIRLDGESLWAIRHNGWCELGFRESYFREQLGRRGWRVRKLVCRDTPLGVVFIAQRG